MFRPSSRDRTLLRTLRSRRVLLVAAHVFTIAVMLSVPAAAFADPGQPTTVLAAKTLAQVISGLQGWIMGLLLAIATFFAVLAGVYWATAGGDPSQVDKAKSAAKNAAIGYGLAVLAPVLMEALKGIVGGP